MKLFPASTLVGADLLTARSASGVTFTTTGELVLLSGTGSGVGLDTLATFVKPATLPDTSTVRVRLV